MWHGGLWVSQTEDSHTNPWRPQSHKVHRGGDTTELDEEEELGFSAIGVALHIAGRACESSFVESGNHTALDSHAQSCRPKLRRNAINPDPKLP